MAAVSNAVKFKSNSVKSKKSNLSLNLNKFQANAFKINTELNICMVPVTKEPIKTQGSGVSYANHLLIRRSRESPSENRNHEIQQFGKRSYRCFDVRNPLSRPFYSIEMRPLWEDEVNE